MTADPLLCARFDDGATVTLYADRVVIGGTVLGPADFEPAFAARGMARATQVVGARSDVRVLSWIPGFGCHVAHCRVGAGGRHGREFRFVREGLGVGFFDLDGVAAAAGRKEATC